MSLATPIVLADGLDVTFYSDADDVWFDVEPFFIEEDYPLPRGLAAALLVVVAAVFGAAIGASVAGTDEPALKVLQAVAGVGAVAALLAAAVQVWRERRWWPWVALHVALIAVATAVALLAG